MTALVDRLEARGLVRRIQHPSDRRVTLIELTETTWSSLAEIYRPIGQAVVDLVDPLAAQERAALVELVRQLADVLDRQPRAP